jgi:hypothetical protein
VNNNQDFKIRISIYIRKGTAYCICGRICGFTYECIYTFVGHFNLRRVLTDELTNRSVRSLEIDENELTNRSI